MQPHLSKSVCFFKLYKKNFLSIKSKAAICQGRGSNTKKTYFFFYYFGKHQTPVHTRKALTGSHFKKECLTFLLYVNIRVLKQTFFCKMIYIIHRIYKTYIFKESFKVFFCFLFDNREYLKF